MRHSKRSFRFRLGLLSLSVAALLVPATTASAGGGCTTFTLKAHPEVGSPPFDQLYGIDGMYTDQEWAVGSSTAAGKPLIEHWNGNKWSIVAAPDKGSTTELYDVTVISPSNVWAVGYYTAAGGHNRTLIEHWNGNKWSIVASPNPIAGADNFLKGVDGVKANNVWAVGSNGRPGNKTIIEHWNGTKWVSVHGASLPLGGDLQEVAVISGTNVVAVGSAGTSGGTDALIERFDGSNWTREDVPPEATAGAVLTGVSARTASRQWAAGSRTGSASLQTLTLRNTGSGWDVVDSPNVGTDKINFFNDISAESEDDAWAVGEHDSNSFVRRTLVAHFSNGSWKVVPSPNSGSDSNRLFGVATNSGAPWIVGTANHPIGSTGLIELSCSFADAPAGSSPAPSTTRWPGRSR